MSKKWVGWRTMLVVPELQTELVLQRKFAHIQVSYSHCPGSGALSCTVSTRFADPQRPSCQISRNSDHANTFQCPQNASLRLARVDALILGRISFTAATAMWAFSHMSAMYYPTQCIPFTTDNKATSLHLGICADPPRGLLCLLLYARCSDYNTAPILSPFHCTVYSLLYAVHIKLRQFSPTIHDHAA